MYSSRGPLYTVLLTVLFIYTMGRVRCQAECTMVRGRCRKLIG